MRKIRKIRIVLSILILLLILSGCGSSKTDGYIEELEDIKDLELTIAYPDDLVLDERIHELCPGAKTIRIPETEAKSSFKSNRIDAYIAGENIANNIVNNSGGELRMLDTPVEIYDIVYALSETSKIPDLKNKVNEFIAKGHENGLFDEVFERWQSPNYNEEMSEVPLATNPKYTLTVGTVGFNKPFCYYKNNVLTGAEIEIAYHLAAYLNAEIVFEDSSYNGILAGISAGKYDILTASLFYTKERAESIDCSDPYYCMKIKMLAKNNPDKKPVALVDLNGKKAGVITGTPHEDMIKKVVDNASYEYYNNYSDLGLALEQNKIDFFVNNDVAYKFMKEEYPDFIDIKEKVTAFDIGTIFPKGCDNKELIIQYNEYIERIKKDGTLKNLQEYWLNNNKWEKLSIVKDGENGTLVLTTCTSNKPFAMMLDGDFAGFDVAIVNGFCEEYGYGLRIEDCDFSGMLAGIAGGKYDLGAGQIAYTEERAESVIYSDFYYEQQIVAVTKDASASEGSNVNFIDTICSGFKKTFIDEDRYLMILEGINVTLIITVFGFILANLLGALLCAMSMSGYSGLRLISNVYSKIMQGTPVVVVLMITYYVIFGKSSISNIFVSIITFGFSTAAYIAQIYKGAIEQVSKGEIEAALALGLSRFESYMGIVFPQAFKHCITPLGSQLVSLMKGTAVVGYIAVMDMTKVSDIVRSSTYEAFFPLLSIALIYFLVSTIILLTFDKLRFHMDPANRKASKVV